MESRQGAKDGYLPLSTQDIKHASPPVTKHQLLRASLPSLSQASLGRHKDRFVSLPANSKADEAACASEGAPTENAAYANRGRIVVCCTAEAYDRTRLEATLRARQSTWLLSRHPDVLYGQYWQPGMSEPHGHIFYFDYGVVAFWGLTSREEQDVLQNVLRPVEIEPIEHEKDSFTFVYSSDQAPNIQNDVITVNYTASMHLNKLAICFALSQSAKLLVYEARVQQLVESTKDLPTQLARNGKVALSRKQVAQLIGQVFLQQNQISLLSTVVDTPEFFWTAPDSLQVLYKSAHEYLENDVRIMALKSRLEVLQDLLDLLRDHQNAHHATKLEWVVIWLIVIECVVGFLEVGGLFGWFGVH